MSASASGTFGVMRNARGRSRSRIAATAASGSRLRPCLLTITGSTTSGKAKSAAARATASTISAEPSAPVFAAPGGMSSSTAASCSSTSCGRHHLHARDAHGVLHGEQRDHRFAIDAELMEGLEVGLNARAAARVASGDREGDGRHSPRINGRPQRRARRHLRPRRQSRCAEEPDRGFDHPVLEQDAPRGSQVRPLPRHQRGLGRAIR